MRYLQPEIRTNTLLGNIKSWAIPFSIVMSITMEVRVKNTFASFLLPYDVLNLGMLSYFSCWFCYIPTRSTITPNRAEEGITLPSLFNKCVGK